MRFRPSGTIQDRRCIQHFSSRSHSLWLSIESEGWCIHDKTVMIMPSNNEGLPFWHLLKCLDTVVSFLCSCLDNGPEI